MKHAMQKIIELVNDVEAEPLVKFSSVESGDFIIASYKIGSENWFTLCVDCDLNDEYEIDSKESALRVSTLDLEESAAKDLYEELKKVFG